MESRSSKKRRNRRNHQVRPLGGEGAAAGETSMDPQLQVRPGGMAQAGDGLGERSVPPALPKDGAQFTSPASTHPKPAHPDSNGLLDIADADWERLRTGRHAGPHSILGPHPHWHREGEGRLIRAFHPSARAADLLFSDGRVVALKLLREGGLFGAPVPNETAAATYQVRFRSASGEVWECDDPYRFSPTLGPLDLHLIGQGTHMELWKRLGARITPHEGVEGMAFSVWSPNAEGVSLVGDFNFWDDRPHPMRQLGASGIFEIFIPRVEEGMRYKYAIRTRDGRTLLKTDPMAKLMESPPHSASRVYRSRYEWRDAKWIAQRDGTDWLRRPVSILEVHAGSWARVPEQGQRWLTYRELAPRLIEHARRFGFTHVELMPLAEHPFGASWGYQVTGYYAPTWRYGGPDDLRYFVDECHRAGIGVLLDWVPGHFPKDDFALARFDGTALYEHEDPRRGEHPDWGTLIFNYERHEVRNFLIANALYWLEEFHVDGLRVDAVASMLYHDYSRRPGQWLPNRYGGKENIEALEFLREVNGRIHRAHPGCLMIAEESTSWGGVTAPPEQGGLGFTFKWNMGWMNDTLRYFARDPIHRRFHQNDLTFAMLYEHSEHFINALSHDEVVHGKGTLLSKMPGDPWRKFANLRILLAYQYTRPGKILLFMDTPLAPEHEWYYDAGLDWRLAEDPARKSWMHYMERLGHLYLRHACLWGGDPDAEGFYWIDCNDHENSVISYVRQHQGRLLTIVLNLTPVPREHYRIGVPVAGPWRILLNTDDSAFGGSGYPAPAQYHAKSEGAHGHAQALELTLPPLAALLLEPVDL